MAFERVRPTKQQLSRYGLPPAFGGRDVIFDSNVDRRIDTLLGKAQRVMDGAESFTFDDVQKAIALLVVGKD